VFLLDAVEQLLNIAQPLLKRGNAQRRLPGMKIFNLGKPVAQMQNNFLRQTKQQSALVMTRIPSYSCCMDFRSRNAFLMDSAALSMLTLSVLTIMS